MLNVVRKKKGIQVNAPKSIFGIEFQEGCSAAKLMGSHIG